MLFVALWEFETVREPAGDGCLFRKIHGLYWQEKGVGYTASSLLDSLS